MRFLEDYIFGEKDPKKKLKMKFYKYLQKNHNKSGHYKNLTHSKKIDNKEVSYTFYYLQSFPNIFNKEDYEIIYEITSLLNEEADYALTYVFCLLYFRLYQANVKGLKNLVKFNNEKVDLHEKYLNELRDNIIYKEKNDLYENKLLAPSKKSKYSSAYNEISDLINTKRGPKSIHINSIFLKYQRLFPDKFKNVTNFEKAYYNFMRRRTDFDYSVINCEPRNKKLTK